ncbi:MAG: hypothetical protein ACI8T1_003016 [Verrucomicrobiales bacterium]|jgi:hypothetical protein
MICRALLALALGNVTSQADSVFNDRHVLVIGIDGCRPDSILPADAPHLHQLIENGVVTYRAFAGGEKGRASQQATSSGPGWSSILTGVWLDKHGVRNNDFTGDHYDQYPHFFQRLKEVEPDSYLSSIVSWNPIDTSIVAPVDAYTDFRGKGQGGNEVVRDHWVRDEAVEHLQTEDPDVLFLHLDQVDGAGHGNGYGPHIPSYLRAIGDVDALIGDVLDAIEARPNRDQEDWLTIVTTDHGGLGSSHGGQTDDERTIFFLVSGDQTAQIVSERQPGHTAVPWTVLEYLGLPIEAAWGWEEEAFGLPPYPPSQLRASPGIGKVIVLRWKKAIDLEAKQLVLKRNGRELARLPVEATQFVDEIPDAFFALQVVYTLEVEGSEKAITPLQFQIDVPKSLADALVLHWPLDGDADDTSGNGHHGTVSGPSNTAAGAFKGQAISFGQNEGAEKIITPLTDALRFERFTDFSIGLWVRTAFSTDGVLIGNKPSGKSANEGWGLSILGDGSLRLNIGDGIRQETLATPLGVVSGGDWHHVGVDIDRLDVASIYIDGQLIASASVEQLKASDGPGPLSLGEGIKALIDDLRIWRRSLTDDEWQSLYEDRAGPHAWRNEQFDFGERFDPEVGLWESDPDRDGRTNLEEFALGSNLRKPDATPALRVEFKNGSPVLLLSQSTGGTGDPLGHYRVHGISSILEMSLDLGTWQILEDSGNMLEIDYHEDGTHSVRWQPEPSHQPRYYRMRYTLEDDSN